MEDETRWWRSLSPHMPKRTPFDPSNPLVTKASFNPRLRAIQCVVPPVRLPDWLKNSSRFLRLPSISFLFPLLFFHDFIFLLLPSTVSFDDAPAMDEWMDG